MTCTDVKRRNVKVKMHAKPRNGRIVIGVLLAVLLVCVAVGVALHLRDVEIEQQTQVQLRDDFVAELERNEGTYDAQSIVLYNTSRAKAQELAEKFGASLRMTKDGKFATLTLPEGTTILDVCRDEENLAYIEQLSADYQVSISELTQGEEDEESDDERLPMRPTYKLVYDTDYDKQTYLDYMNMQNVWAGYTGWGVTVAVIDTGIDTDHPEFAGRISEYSYNATEDKIVKDYVLENGEYDWSLVEDEQGHGTAVTGVLAASMNSGNVVGIAPEVTIITIKAECDENGIFKRSSDLLFGLYYAIERDVAVVNMSFGAGEGDWNSALQLAYDSDVICVAAAGNDSTAELASLGASPLVIGVGALADESWELAEYSNYGENVNVVAPGTTYTSLMGGGYGYMDGTSLACPAVAGLIALYMQHHLYVTFDQLTEELYASCYDLGDLGCDWYFGYGAVDANAFLMEERGTITYDMLTDEVDDLEGTFIRGHALQEFPEPDRLYAVFDGWYYDEHCTQPVEYYTDAFYSDLTLYANWVNEDDGIPFTYRILDDGTVEILSYIGHRRFITIPEKIEDRVVSSIGDFAFAGETNLREVGLPSGLRHIGMYAFAGCSNLVSMYIPENVTEIESRAFAECVRLSTIAFTGQSKLLTIGKEAFFACGKLRTLELPMSLQSVNGAAFVGTSALTTIRVQSGNQYFKSEDGVLFDVSGETLVAYPAAHGTSYEIPASVKTVGHYAFYGAKVIFLDLGQIQTIGVSAFARTSVLTVNIPDTVTVMEMAAFRQSAVREVTIGTGLTEISVEAFEKCVSLSVVHISDGIEIIGDRAFSTCPSLSSVYIPSGVSEIRSEAFFESGLVNVTFDEYGCLQSIGNAAFARCPLSEVHIPASVIELGSATAKIEDTKQCTDVIMGVFERTPLTKITFAENSQLQMIGNKAFAYSSITSIDLPQGLEYLGMCTFWYTPLEAITLPASLKMLGEGAFGYTTSLSAIKVADGNATYHDVDGVVYNCDNTAIYAYPADRSGDYEILDTVCKIVPYSFAGTQFLYTLTIPEKITEIEEYTFSYSGAHAYELPATLRSIQDYGFYSNDSLYSIILPESLQQIGAYAFYNCRLLTTIHIPDNVLQIGRYAFYKCWNLSSITFNETAKLPRISYGSFAYCGLQSFRVPANVSTMAQGAFMGCSNLTSVTFAENSKLESISAYMFDGCSNLQTITFEQGSALTSVQAHGLEGMDKLTQINWGDAKVVNIDNFAFRFCDSLAELTLPDTVTNVGRYAFYGCTLLSELTLPASMEHVGSFAFLGTNDLNLYLIADTVPAYLDEDWDYGIRGYYVGVTNVTTDGDYKYATLTSGDVSIIEYLGSETEIDLSVLDFGSPITAIGSNAFEDKGITRIVLPDTLTSIQAEAFAYNPLEEITIPAGVTFIGREAFTYTEIASLTFSEGAQIATIEQYAFECTRNLTEVILPASLTTMGRGVFQQSGLTSVTFEEGIALERIPENAFTETKLTSIVLPDSVNYIDHNAFMEIPTLQSVTFGNAESISLQSNAFYHTGLTSLHIPANVTYIGEYSLVALTNLTEITVDANHPYYKSEDGLLLSKDGRKLIVVPAGRTGSLTVPASVEMLGFGAFEETKLSEVNFVPDANILTLGYRVFFKANNITSIDIPKSVISIDYYAFAYCENLQTVNFAEDNQLKGIYEGAFCGDINLENITIPDTIVEISDFAFYGCSKLDRVPVSENGIVKGIYSYAFAYTGISGEFTTPETLIDIGDYAFMGTKITKLTVPDTNQWDLIIGIGAFEECYKLEEVTLPFIGASLDDMQYSWLGYIFGAGSYEANATYVPASLKTVTITEGQTLVGIGGFAYLTSVETINLPHSICALYNEAFKDTTTRYELTNTIMVWTVMPDGRIDPRAEYEHFGQGLSGHLTLAGAGVLGNGEWTDGVKSIHILDCSDLTGITLPEGITSVALHDCTGLLNIVVPNTVYSLSLEGCSVLTNAVVPDNAIWVTFRRCSSLETLTIGKTSADITLEECNALSSIIVDSENPRYEVIDGILYDKEFDSIYFVPQNVQGHVTIPEYITAIEERAFYYRTGLTGVTISDNVTFIGEKAFFECTGLTDVTISNNVTSISDYAFYGCAGLTSITIPGNENTVGNYAFFGCAELTSVVINSGVESIGERAFSNCGNLTNLTLPEGITHIGAGAFHSCVNLTVLEIPHSVTSIGEAAFGGCMSLRKVTIGDGVTDIKRGTFANCYDLPIITLSANLTYIEESAFSGCRNLKQVINNSSLNIVPGSDDHGQVAYHAETVINKEGVVLSAEEGLHYTLDEHGFLYYEKDGNYTLRAYMGDLETVTLPNDLEGHAYSIKNFKTSAKHVIIPETITSIDEFAFYECSEVTSIFVPDTVTSISDWAFYSCFQLKSINIPEGVTSIGNYAFTNCLSLENVTLPNSLTKIGDSAFCVGRSLTSITIPDNVTYIGSKAFDGCENLMSVNIPNGITRIYNSTFSRCKNLTSIIIPESVTHIGDRAFEGCTGLTSITIPGSVTHIGDRAFDGCTGLTSLSIPESVTYIGQNALPNITNIIFAGENPSYVMIDGILYDYPITRIVQIFDPAIVTVTLPHGLNSIDSSAFAGCINLEQINIPESVTYIGYGAFEGCTGLTSIEIPNTVTRIGSAAFAGCVSLTSVTLSDSLSSIGVRLFEDCTGLTSMNIPEGVTYIDSMAFRGCSGLTSITIPNSVVSIEYGAFNGCTGLTSITIPNSVTSIADSTFGACSSLTSITIPDSVNTIGAGAFSGCSGLTSVKISEGVTTIEDYAFQRCSSLMSITIPDSVTFIGEDAFYECSSLASIEISNSVTSIERYTFGRCISLTSITIPESVTSVEASAFDGCTSITFIEVQEENLVFESVDGVLYNKQEGVLVYVPHAIQGEITIPDYVWMIDDNAFSQRSNLQKITLGKGVTYIGASAFSYTNLKELYIQSNLIEIGENAFRGEYFRPVSIDRVYLKMDISVWLNVKFGNQYSKPSGNIHLIDENGHEITDLVIPDDCLAINNDAFSYFRNIRSVTISDGVKIIGENAFSYCDHLLVVTIGNGVTSIGHNAFYASRGLTKVTIGASVIDMDADAFAGAAYVKNYSDLNVVPDPNYNEVVAVVEDKDGNLLGRDIDVRYGIVNDFIYGERDGEYWLYAYIGELNNIILPESLEGNAYAIYQFKTTAQHVTISEGITEIGQYAFKRCYGLNSITIPDGVKSIGFAAFLDCKNLTSISFGNGLTIIGEQAFASCDGLTNLVLPNGITTIGGSAFSSCMSLTSVVLPNSVTSIGKEAFFNCTSLTSINIPDSVGTIKKDAFLDTGYYNNPSNWENGCLALDGWLLRVDSQTRYLNLDEIKGAAEGAYVGCYLLKNALWDGTLSGATNVETLVIKDIKSAGILGQWPNTLPSTLKNIIVTQDVGITELRDNPEIFKYVSGVTIYVEKNKKNLRWDSNFLGWNNENSVCYGDEWTQVTFCDVQGTIIFMGLRKNEQVIRKPVYEIAEDVANVYEFIGWDINGDGVADSVPATMITDLVAHPVYDIIPKEYSIIFKDSETGEIYKQEMLHYGDTIILPETPTREDGYLIGWVGYEGNMTVTGNAEILTKWHVHAYRVVVTSPSCTEQGYSTHTCQCGDVYVDSYVDALDHSYGEWYQTVAPTCTTEGENKHDCSRCDYFETEVVPANVHTHATAVEENHIYPTCTEIGGYDMVVYCTVCGVELSRDHYEIDALGHDMGEWYQTVAPTCTTEGENKHDCSRCDYFETEVVPANVHTHATAVEENHIYPTCTEIGGYDMAVYCAVCDTELNREHYEIDALGHMPADAVIENRVNPTCTEIGTYDMVVYCSVCGVELSREHHEIDATGHSHNATVIAPTCIEQGYTIHTCHCGDSYADTYVEANGHDMFVWYESIAPTCTEQGENRCNCLQCDYYETTPIEALGHSPATEWTVDLAPTCTADGSKSLHCTRCDTTLDTAVAPATGHSHTATVTAPTCNGKGFTSYYCHCSDFYIGDYVDALGHTEVIDEAVAPTCTATGLTEGSHCSVCNEILVAQEVVPANGHSHESVVTDPTCTEKGYTTHTCHCGDSYVDSEVDALGHTPSDWIVDAEAQIGVEGSKHKECTVCGETLETEAIEALPEEPSGGCNGTISASVVLIALLGCIATAWRPRKDN